MPPDPAFDFIDLAPSLDAIRSKYGDRYYISLDAMWEAAALWGIARDSSLINQAGVFTSATVVLAVAAGGCTAEARLVQTPNGWCAMSTDYSTRVSGGGYAPSVWSRSAFRNVDDARLAAVHELIGRLESEFRCASSCNTDANRREIRSTIALLEAQKRPQLSLF
ncbi:MAG: hypothetical protein AB7F89_11750 [Pirellulaceae bacterium]